jgi:hypothetical protein
LVGFPYPFYLVFNLLGEAAPDYCFPQILYYLDLRFYCCFKDAPMEIFSEPHMAFFFAGFESWTHRLLLQNN